MATRAQRRAAGESARANLKIVITGPFAAGKTTFIRTISEITVLATERGVSDSTRARKAETTVAMDHGRITIDRELVLTLFGTPGQDRFEFMWEVLSEGMLGYVLLLDGSQPTPALDAVTILRAFRELGPRTPFVVAVNQRDALSDAEIADVRSTLELDDETPVLPVNALDRVAVRDVLVATLERVRSRTKQPQAV